MEQLIMFNELKLMESGRVKRGQLPKGIKAGSIRPRLPKRLNPDFWMTYDELLDSDHEYLARRSYRQDKPLDSDIGALYDL